MSLTLTPLQCGSAILVALEGAEYVRLLRKTALPFTGPADPAATLIFEGGDDEGRFGVLDDTAVDGVLYAYQAYERVSTGPDVYAPLGPPRTATAAATYVERTTDVRKLLIDRLTVGFRQEIARGLLRIKPQPGQTVGEVAVLSAPPQFKSTAWPVCGVHLSNEAPDTRGVGETMAPSEGEDEGWLGAFAYDIAVYSQSPDERGELHKAVRRILMANLPVFDLAGVVTVEFNARDQDAISGEYPAPVYMSVFSLTCRAPVRIESPASAPVIRDVQVIAIASAIATPSPT